MLLNYSECIKRYGNDYQIGKKLNTGELYKIEQGIYSSEKNVSELEVIMKKYPDSVLTGEYAFYCQGLTEFIPEKYVLGTKYKAAKIMDQRVFQVYIRDDLFDKGIEEKKVDGVNVRIYDKERLLIELLRNKNSMPYDLYKEILLNYRRIINELTIWRIQKYAEIFPKSKMIKRALEEEVM